MVTQKGSSFDIMLFLKKLQKKYFRHFSFFSLLINFLSKIIFHAARSQHPLLLHTRQDPTYFLCKLIVINQLKNI